MPDVSMNVVMSNGTPLMKLVAELAVKGLGLAGTFGRIEGMPVADWVLIDADDVIVHLFRPEVRSFYNLERMWAFGDEKAAATA